MNLGHVPLPVVLSGKGPAAAGRVVAAGNRAVKLLLLFMTVVDVPLQMRLCSEALATSRVVAFVVFAMIALVVPRGRRLATAWTQQNGSRNILEFVRLVKGLVTARLVTVVQPVRLGRRYAGAGNVARRRAVSEVGAVQRLWRRAVNLRGRGGLRGDVGKGLAWERCRVFGGEARMAPVFGNGI